MMSGKSTISRRTVLRGMGAAMALPWMEAMGQAPALAGAKAAATPAGAAPLRMAFVFTPNGVHYPTWAPAGEGAGYKLSETLSPLESVRKHVNVLTGLTLDKARANGDGPGDHARSSATFLTGMQARKTAGNDINLGISVDQFAAEQIGDRTRFSSLEIGCEQGRRAGSCDSGYSCAYSSHLSWKDEDTPVPKMIDPAAVFESFFGTRDKQATLERVSRRQSILDFVMSDAKRLEQRISANDRNKLDEFQTSIREIERRIEHARTETEANVPPEGAIAPAGIPRQVGEHLDLMYDMLLLAFQTDQTRIASFMTGTGGSNRTFAEIGVTDGHHNLSHHRGDEAMVEKIKKIDMFYVEHFARFIQKAAEIEEGEASLLDNCMIMFGSGISDGNKHNHEDLPIVMAGGGAGTIDTGRHIAYDRETPLCNLYISMLDRMGCDVDSFGDSTGPLSRLIV
ncbi:MAG: DUF1552 domain-containing protein [Phycisphaera sp.]|nr:MAG: DUF1552 domain-containing protein [Phycisphaera sp.]